jgi:hypothetical protein
MMGLSKNVNTISCYKGLERSVLMVDALTAYNRNHSPGIPVQLYPGGMRRMQTMTIPQLQSEVSPTGLVTLIHDRSDNPDVVRAWLACKDLLRQTERAFQTVDTDQVYIFLRSLKINPDEYKY